MSEKNQPDTTEKSVSDSNPKHVAIIMDGNGRWAKQKKLPRTLGHKKGVDSIRRTLKESINHNINYLSLYAFSEGFSSFGLKVFNFLIIFFRCLIFSFCK